FPVIRLDAGARIIVVVAVRSGFAVGSRHSMFRALLTYPLIFAVAVGPLLCCCTAGRVLAAAVPTPVKSPRPETPAPTPRASAHACCAHKHQPTPAEPKPTSPAPGSPCPCKDGATKIQAVQPTDTAAELTEHLRVVSLDPVT